MVVNDGSFDDASDFYVVPSCSPHPSFPFDDYLDFSCLPPATACDQTRSDVLRSQEQASADPDTSSPGLDTLDTRFPSPFSFETSPYTDDFNPEPGDVAWNQLSQVLDNQFGLPSTGNVTLAGFNTSLDWGYPLDSTDVLYPTSSMWPQYPPLPETESTPTRLVDSCVSSDSSQPPSDASSRKRSWPSHSSSPEPSQPHKRLMSSAAYRCKWNSCSETFDHASTLR